MTTVIPTLGGATFDGVSSFGLLDFLHIDILDLSGIIYYTHEGKEIHNGSNKHAAWTGRDLPGGRASRKEYGCSVLEDAWG
jgi:hypothetical protein